jgi:tRNA (mo5U34)-methyltransferase
MAADADDLRTEIASTLWYHTIELAPGVVTPGWFDLRSVVDRLPWPDVAGKRCLDIGTYDGFMAFEMERRGAAEVVAIDIDDHTKWDWPPDVRATGGANLALLAGPEKGRGFRIAAATLGSKVERRPMSVYDLDPATVGRFDVVVMGSLLLHLRDPLRALEAVREVCAGVFMSVDEIDLPLTVQHRRRPVARLNGVGELCQWWVPNAAGHRQMVTSAGFQILRSVRPYTEPYGAAHHPLRGARHVAHRLLQRLVTNGPGVPHSAVLARPSS